ADLDEVTTLQHTTAYRLSGNIRFTESIDLHVRAAHLQRRMIRRDALVLEQVDVTLLAAADAGELFIKDELLASEWPRSHIEPPLFESAFHDPNGHAGGQTDKSEPDCTARCAAARRESNRIKYHAPDARAE